jgi:hypothetical protein
MAIQALSEVERGQARFPGATKLRPGSGFLGNIEVRAAIPKVEIDKAQPPRGEMREQWRLCTSRRLQSVFDGRSTLRSLVCIPLYRQVFSRIPVYFHNQHTPRYMQRYRLYTGNETKALSNGRAPDYQAVLV